MLPYVAQPTLQVGPIHVYAFGVLVAIAVLVGTAMARRRAVRVGLDGRTMDDLLFWIVGFGFVFGHVLDLVLYEPSVVLHEPLRLFAIWDGLGSFGGFVGAVIGAIAFARRRKLGRRLFAYLDAVAWAFPFGWIFGRLGCTLAFDHVGRETTFFLGERYVDGVVRHNLGLEEALFTIVVAAAFAALGRKPRRTGFFLGLLPLAYAPVRFALDALRVEDTRYLGLTPAQYGSVLLAGVGAAILLATRRRARDLPEAAPAE